MAMMISSNVLSAYFKVAVVSHGNEKLTPTQLIRCSEDMTFRELFSITRHNCPFESLDDSFEIFLMNFEMKDMDVQIQIPDKYANFFDTCFDEAICPVRPLIQFRVKGIMDTQFITNDDTCGSKDTDELMVKGKSLVSRDSDETSYTSKKGFNNDKNHARGGFFARNNCICIDRFEDDKIR